MAANIQTILAITGMTILGQTQMEMVLEIPLTV